MVFFYKLTTYHIDLTDLIYLIVINIENFNYCGVGNFVSRIPIKSYRVLYAIILPIL